MQNRHDDENHYSDDPTHLLCRFVVSSNLKNNDDHRLGIGIHRSRPCSHIPFPQDMLPSQYSHQYLFTEKFVSML